jgi:hypothetical protein
MPDTNKRDYRWREFAAFLKVVTGVVDPRDMKLASSIQTYLYGRARL